MAQRHMSHAAGLTVVDLGAGLPRLLSVVHFADLGCPVLKSQSHIDPLEGRYPAFTRLGSRQKTVPAAEFAAALATADVCILGGEDHPDLESVPSAASLVASHPRLIVLEFSGGVDAQGKPRPAVDLLAQARSGLCFDQLGDRPFAWPLPMVTFAMTLYGLIGVWAALIDRQRTGRGQIVSVSMQSGAAALSSPDRIGFERPSALMRKLPPAVRQMILRCADGNYVQFAKLPGQLQHLYAAFGIPIEGDPATLETRVVLKDPRDFFADHDLFSEYAAKLDSKAVLEALWKLGTPADVVLAPGGCWSDEQVEANGSIVKDPNGVRGVDIPIRFSSAPDTKAGRKQDARRAAATEAQADLPLKGLKVVGLGAYIAGPAASRPLADLGADVIKVDPLSGDPSSNTYHHYWACNSGKRSIRINLKTPEGIALLQQLCGRADVVHHNFRRGVVDRFGIDPETLRKRPAPVVTLRCDAYGVTGPKADYPGFDQIALGITGHEVRAGGAGNAPLWYRNCIADYTAGMLGSLGILIGLFERNHSGTSVDAQVNLLDSGLYLMSELIQNPDGSFAGAPGNDAEQLGVSATERIYAVRNGWIAVATRGAAMSAALLRALGLPADLLARDDARVARSIGEKLQDRRLDEALELFQTHGVWSEACRNLEGAAIDRDPAAVSAGLVYHVEDPAFGHVAATGPFIKLSAVQARYSPRAPHLGEHSSAIMSELGYSKQTIEEYLERSIIS